MPSESAPDSVKGLVDRFDQDLKVFQSPDYKEEQLRVEFLNPLFTALGWDIDNKAGLSETFKQVIHEESIKVAGASEAPDYTFRIGGKRVFFLEAKKPAVNIVEDFSPAFQLRRYAWTSRLPVSILSDFEKFAVYDGRFQPLKTDKPATGRTMLLGYRDYIQRWEELCGLFSPEAIQRGALERYVESTKTKKGTTTVDDAFLNEISRWRDLLARDIALRNPSLKTRQLNFAVQRTIDRLIFLRICEDRGIESYAFLQSLLNGERVYSRLVEHFRNADDKYNSGLFHFSDEKDFVEKPDKLCLDLHIDDKPLRDIIGNLYYPESPYEFSVMPADVLGQVYEQFLGKVIRLTAGHQAKVEEKPEVRKAGGVYYTPTYIVDYIVKNTVGKLLEGKTPKEASELRILDPACGSGSFLLGAYQCLLDWHLDYYHRQKPQASNRKSQAPVYQDVKGNWRLTTTERKRILLNNIYGVDIDSQAVEVTKLSLLLKVLEGENQETLQNQLRLFHERALPDLGSNIKCGNSLISSDFYQNQQFSLFDEEEKNRINVFDWSQGFPDIMKAGGFDAVIGNPPYIRVQAMNEWIPEAVNFYKQHYASASKGNYDIYVVFVEKGLSLLNYEGTLGFILPHKFFNSQYGESLRSLIANGKHLSNVVYFGDQQVFSGAMTYTCLMFLAKTAVPRVGFVRVDNLDDWRLTGKAVQGFIASKSVGATEWNFAIGSGSGLLNRLRSMSTTLADVADRIFQGLVTGADPVFLVTNRRRGSYYSDATNREHRLEPELLHPLLKGSVNIRRYAITNIEKSILFPYALSDKHAELLTTGELASDFPLVWKYMQANRARLEARERGKWKHSRWYAFGRSQNLAEMEQPKLLTPSIANAASFTFDREGRYYFVGSGGGGGGGYGITLKAESGITSEYILGLLNSRLLDYYLQSISSRFSGGYYAYNRQYIEQLPIVTADKTRHDTIVKLVETMLKLHKDLPKAKTPDEQESIQRQIEAADKQIDQLVYELYGLTEEEIKIVEEPTLR